MWDITILDCGWNVGWSYLHQHQVGLVILTERSLLGAVARLRRNLSECHDKLPDMPARTCLVTIRDMRGTRHEAQVQAESLYEAGVLGLAALKASGWCGEFGPMTTLEVQVLAPTVVHKLTVQQITRWLDGATSSPNEQVRKRKLKEMLAS